MKPNFIKIDSEKALYTKKEVLNMLLHIIYLRERIKNFALIKKKNIAIKNKLLEDIKSLRKKVNTVISSLPRGYILNSVHPVTEEVKISIEKTKKIQDIEEELFLIRKDLQKLEGNRAIP
jgi:hypothetical protein